MVDCSHENSLKVHANQLKVAKNLAEQMAQGEEAIMGVMIERISTKVTMFFYLSFFSFQKNFPMHIAIHPP